MAFSFFWTVDALSETVKTIKGIAYSDFAAKNIVYFEEHRGFFGSSGILRSENDYFDTNRKKIAELVSDYSQSKYMPTYIFRNLRNGEEEGLRFKDGKYLVFRKKSGSEIEEKFIQPEIGTFSCQGWHYFIIENMAQIERENVSLNLIFPGKLDQYQFSIKKVSSEGDILKLRLEFKNWFIRIFAPNLELEYDSEKQKLISFTGPSNLPDEDGNIQRVTVVYE
jgi:hypothetical protein